MPAEALPGLNGQPLRLSALDAAGARELLNWRYEPPYAIYNAELADTEFELAMQFLLDPQYAYQRIDNPGGELCGFCCFGLDAQVPGGDYRLPAIDIGLGVRPDLTGRGFGGQFVASVLRFAEQHYAGLPQRVTIAEFNLRARRVWQRAGFLQTQRFLSPVLMPFVVMVRQAV